METPADLVDAAHTVDGHVFDEAVVDQVLGVFVGVFDLLDVGGAGGHDGRSKG
jgi:hypothetical protein